jgi:hypothetical protein
MKMNNKGQFSIIAALLVAVILIGTVISTYSAIRYNNTTDQPQILSAVDETNLALKQLLGFTLGYYGSVLQVTGNTTYAQNITRTYLNSGLENIANTKPELGASFNVTSIALHVEWYGINSFSFGNLNVTYNLVGLGFYGLKYSPVCKLAVQVLPSVSGQAQLVVSQDENEPLNTLSDENFKFYRYLDSETWGLTNPNSIEEVTLGGTYSIIVPSGIDSTSYFVQVEDARGIMVVASSFSHFTSTSTWSVSYSSGGNHYVDQLSDIDSSADKGSHNVFNNQKAKDGTSDILVEQNNGPNTEQFVTLQSNVDGSADIGTHSNFNLQKAGPDSQFDTLTEANTVQSGTEILRPVGTGASSSLSHNTGTSNWGCVDEASSDDDTTYVYTTSTSNSLDSYSMGNHIVGTGTISSVIVHVQARRSSTISNGYAKTIVRTHNTNYQSSDFSLTTSYSSYSTTYVTNPNTGAAWTWAEIDALECGVSLRTASSSYRARCTQVWVEVNYVPAANYELDLEEQFTGVDFNQANKWLCIYAGSLGAESLRVDVRSGSNWINVISGLQPNQWNNVSLASYMAGPTFSIKLYGDLESGDTTQNNWQIDCVLIHTWTVNYELDLEEQFTGVDFNQANKWLCIYAGSLGAESLRVDVRSGSNWINVISGLQPNQWNNVSVSTWLIGSTFTIRFNGGTETGDTTQDNWNIDAVMLRLDSNYELFSSLQDSTIVVEWLQNGTMRRMGQNLNLTTMAKPIPPIPVKAIHINQTLVDGTNREVPFQVEDWASSYSIPLGLTSNATVFSNKQMLVYLLDKTVAETIIWWNGSDQASQPPTAYSNVYFTGDDQGNNRLTNGGLTLQFGSGFTLTSTVGGTTSTANFMRINSEASVYGASAAYVIHHGVVRDIVQQEAEWNDGADNCPNLYANIVITLPARTSYYTYQLRFMFLNSQQDRTINDLCPIKITAPYGTVQTENGVSNGMPIVATGNNVYYNTAYPAIPGTAHHWSQCVTGSSGAGIIYTDSANKLLYAFDSFVGSATGAIKATNGSTSTIELLPVTRSTANHYNNALDITWSGAVATFSSATSPIYDANGGNPTGLWILAEYQPTISVATGT